MRDNLKELFGLQCIRSDCAAGRTLGRYIDHCRAVFLTAQQAAYRTTLHHHAFDGRFLRAPMGDAT